MPVNSTYIASAPDIFTRMSRFSSETGFLFGHGILIIIAVIAAYSTREQGSSISFIYASMWSFFASIFLWLASWESESVVVFCGCVFLLSIMIKKLGSA